MTRVIVVCVLLWVCATARAEEKLLSVERGLLRQAPKLIKHFGKNNYKNVGVLKFLVAGAGSKEMSDNAGTMNMLLARRLEVALILANDVREPIGVIKNASAVAARTKEANHRTPRGREALFGADYPLAWGKQDVKADAFVTGLVTVEKDLKSMKIALRIFDRTKNKVEPFGDDFTVATDAGKLTEMNETFVLRGGDHPSDGEALKIAAAVRTGDEKHPLAKAEVPIRLEVLYDGKEVKVEYRGGKAYIPEPKEGQKVALRLKRDKSKVRYGVVLKVNGENTIGEERLPDAQCRRWILDSGDSPPPIAGYQMDNAKAKEFRVMSRAESKAREMDYGEDVGTISLTVYRELKGVAEIPGAGREDEQTAVVERVRMPSTDTLTALKKQLLEESNETRGLLGEGNEIVSKTVSVKFTPEPTPVMSVTIVYYKP